MALTLLRTVDEARAWSRSASAKGATALVPTMGFLHEGHLSLMRDARGSASSVAVSIFVNPTQFGPKEDLSRYPRDLEGDCAKCEQAGVDAVFAPDTAAIYPKDAQTWVEVAEVSRGLCGEKRPGHFRGVATVVTKLLCLFRPDVALFGEKDYQQLQVIRTLVRDLQLGVEILGRPTVREVDGLALSSRNSYLTSAERTRALALSRSLLDAQRAVRGGQLAVRELIEVARRTFEAAEVREDYIEVVDPHTLRPLSQLQAGQPARMLVAGFVGSTRLIDNVELGV